jgi:hypothetical protein
MIGILLRVSSSELKSYLENSSLLEERVYPEEYSEDSCHLNLDKAWENIYFLLTGYSSSDFENATPPLSLIFFNGAPIDENLDMGYGPATYATTEEVKEIAKALPESNKELLRAKFESLKSNDAVLYPFAPNSEDLFDWIFENYESMKEFYEIASKNEQAVISFIN